MIAAVRNEEILRFIREQELCTIAELSNRFKVSKATVHRVLNDLDAAGQVRKVRGGVRFPEGAGLEKSFDIRLKRLMSEKNTIARLAFRYVHEGSTIFLGSGTTIATLARELARNFNGPLTVVTDSPMVVLELLHTPHIKVICTGGELQYDLNTFAGPLAYDAMDRLQFGTAFISAAAVSKERGIMTAQAILVRLLGKIIERADEVNLLVDHTKFTKIAPLAIAPLSSMDRIVTDEDLDSSVRESILSAGVEFVTG
jgi:DeoR/GlpR family transcriptional regulator of sugar metabolism